MTRMSDLTEEELLMKEEAWLEQGDESEVRWINEGIRIYKQLAKENRKEIRYKESVANLLLQQGEDLKMRTRAYDEAIKRFNHLLHYDPDYPRAYYRLGFLYFHQEKWIKSIDSFQQALNGITTKKRNQLDKEQQIKAHHYILKSTQIILNDSLGKVDKIPDEDLDLFGEIKVLRNELKAGLQEKPYQMIVDGEEVNYISENEYEKLTDPDKNTECFVLNQRTMNDTFISLFGKEDWLNPRYVPLLEYLMRHPDGVESATIIERRQQASKNPKDKLRQDIRRLRENLNRSFPDIEFIKTINGGYQWNWKKEYRMFKHTRDVTSEMLMD
ncbi:tetratricopeptide repeat protein [Aquibacillus rhizosphaerae]|uniref:Tetratricopeptide repeat protein n=1 Tax=Aquibacillus rhizosphaerae TaxID=3051431 RepID=A0ABT7L9F7_9BACI|nr:tetratricopeptide repeat protein [Aquibacillus sp. LR5S19]MDL4842491.1 tetratricopeptide repeat protein [Aquibacillus sp. LR5S19]